MQANTKEERVILPKRVFEIPDIYFKYIREDNDKIVIKMMIS